MPKVSELFTRWSPSSLNLFAECPSMFVAERILGHKQPVGAIAHRGVAIEDGVAHGLKNPKANVDDCADIAYAKYDFLTIMSGDARKEKFREDIPYMIAQALDELKPYGIPSSTQGYIEYHPPQLRLPIIGYYDFQWLDSGIVVDLKTTDRMPSEIKIGHARQVSLYAGDNHSGRLTYVTPKKCQTLELDNIREHREALVKIAERAESFIALSEDPAFFPSIIAPALDNFYWGSPAARALAFEVWKI